MLDQADRLYLCKTISNYIKQVTGEKGANPLFILIIDSNPGDIELLTNLIGDDVTQYLEQYLQIRLSGIPPSESGTVSDIKTN